MLQVIKPISKLDEHSQIEEGKIILVDGLNYKRGTKFSILVDEHIHGENLAIRLSIYPKEFTRSKAKNVTIYSVDFKKMFPMKYLRHFSHRTFTLGVFAGKGKRDLVEMGKLIIENALAIEGNLFIEPVNGDEVKFSLMNIGKYVARETRKINEFGKIFS